MSSKQRIETERDTKGTTTFDVMGIWNFELKYLLTPILAGVLSEEQFMPGELKDLVSLKKYCAL